MNIFDQYGIKEVADVTLYSIELDEMDMKKPKSKGGKNNDLQHQNL